MNIGIFVFNEVEILDFTRPFEVFSTASRLLQRDGIALLIHVHTFAKAIKPVFRRSGLQVMPSHDFDSLPL